MKKIKCIDNTGFALITVGTIYDVVNESRDFYYILNNMGVEKRYGKNRFTEEKPAVKAAPAEKPAPKPKPEPKPKGWVCKFPKGGIVEYNKIYYPLGETKLGDKFLIKVGSQTHEILKSRFVPEA